MPSVNVVLEAVVGESVLWSMARGRALHELLCLSILMTGYLLPESVFCVFGDASPVVMFSFSRGFLCEILFSTYFEYS